MSRPISTDLRERLVLAVSREGISARAAAAIFGVSVSSAIVWVRRHRGTGIVAPGKIGGHKPNILSGTHGDWLVERGQGRLCAGLALRPCAGAELQKKRSSRRTAAPQDRKAARALAQVSGAT